MIGFTDSGVRCPYCSCMKCSKCHYERLPTDDAPAWQCPSCKVAYAKVGQSAAAAETKPVIRSGINQAAASSTQATIDELEARDREQLAAHGQKIVIRAIVINFVLRAVDQSHALPILAINALYFCTAAYSLFGVVKICSGLGRSQNSKILFMVLSFFPLINLVALVYLSAKTNRMLREAGWQIGLLGAKS